MGLDRKWSLILVAVALALLAGLYFGKPDLGASPEAARPPDRPGQCQLDLPALEADPWIMATFPKSPASWATLRGDVYDSAASHGLHTEIALAKYRGCPADLAIIQRLYDIFSWHSLLASSWPQANGLPRWTSWKLDSDIMRAGGVTPGPWGSPRLAPAGFPAHMPGVDVRILSETQQAISQRMLGKYRPDELQLWDQSGNPVYYETLLNQQQADYIIQNKLYNVAGQVAFTKNCNPPKTACNSVTTGPGSLQTDGPSNSALGPIELKLAWKILDKNDIAARFFRMRAWARAPGGQWQRRDVGLVAIHIARKTLSSKMWVWSTFEHVDNTLIDPREAAAYKRAGQTLTPSFYNPKCRGCPVNKPPRPDRRGIRRSQVQRVTPIAPGTAAVNREARDVLRQMGSVWQHYELVGTQYMIKQKQASTNTLVNTAIETYDQHAPAYEQSCMGCHEKAGLIAKNPKTGRLAIQKGIADFSFVFEEPFYARKKPAKSP